MIIFLNVELWNPDAFIHCIQQEKPYSVCIVGITSTDSWNSKCLN